MSDGNTDAIIRHFADREAYYESTQSMVDDIEALRDDVDALTSKLAEVEAERDGLAAYSTKLAEVAQGNYQRAEAAEAALTAARAALVTARNEALDEAAKVAVAYGKVQYSANIALHPQYATDAADDALEIADAIRALPTMEADT